MNKKLLYIIASCLFFLSGCEKKPAEIAPASVFEITDGTTAAGISVGDDDAAFIKAYKDYTIQVAYNDLSSSYIVMSIDDIPYEDNISTLIANFFIDGKPVSEETLCKENDVELSDLFDLLSSSSYLQAHSVQYRYLLFQWTDGAITEIQSDVLNYNETFETPQLQEP